MADPQQGTESFFSKILVATPRLDGDDDFARSVVLLVCEEKRGIGGVILNQTSADLITQHEGGTLPPLRMSVFNGGPLQSDFSVLLRAPYLSSIPWLSLLCRGVGYGDLASSLNDIFKRPLLPGNGVIFHGHAAWAPRQLSHEIQKGFWQVLPFDCALAFPEKREDLWATCQQRLARPSEVPTCQTCHALVP